MNKHARRVRRLVSQKRFFAFAISAALILIVVSGFAQFSRTVLTSPEVKFTDASASGLSIVPASCPSNPGDADAPYGCSNNTVLCPDGSAAPNNDTSACKANLTAGSISPISAATEVETVFSATISNTGGPTGSGFSDLLQESNSADGSGARDVDTASSPELGTQQSSTASFAYMFSSPGIYYLRACADKSSASDPGVIPETNENDNCGPWTLITVSAGAVCPDSSAAPGNDASSCTCAQGNVAACGGLCPDGSSAPNGDSNQCTCAQGNPNQCGGSACTDPNNCAAPSTIPGCRITTSPKSAQAGNTVLVGWASSCASASDGCKTSLGLPEVASGMTLSQSGAGGTQSLGSVQASGTHWAIPSSMPTTFSVSGQLYAGYWPILVPITGSNFSCQVSIAAAQAVCADGSAPVNGQCPSNNNSCVQTGYPRCSADGSSIEYLDAVCHPQARACQWAAQGYGCVSGQCLTPPSATASFNISPKLLSPGSSATITWVIGASTSCSLSATDGDNTGSLSGSGSKSTQPILGQTVYTLNCSENLTGESMPPQSITVNVTPSFIEK